MGKKSLSTTVIVAFVLASLLSPIFLASCSLGAGHDIVMRTIGMSCSTELLRHLTKLQGIFLAFAISLVLAILAPYFVRSVDDESELTRTRQIFFSFRAFSHNMKFFDALRLAFAEGVIGAKRFDTLAV